MARRMVWIGLACGLAAGAGVAEALAGGSTTEVVALRGPLVGLSITHAGHAEAEQIELAGDHPDRAALEAAFEQAATDYGVPAALLEAVAFVESRWVHTGPTIDYGYGIMHLVDNGDAQTLREAAELTGVPVDGLKTDPIANIRGGAAVIAKYASRTVGQPTRLEDYWTPLKLFSGLAADVQAKQAAEYYKVLSEGAAATNALGMQIELAPVDVDLAAIPQEAGAGDIESDDYGPAIWNPAASCNYTASRSMSIDRWVNHWVGTGTYAGAISWFKNCSAQSSAHFVIRQSDGELTQMVRIAHTAWHAGNWTWNSRSIGIEHEATPSYPWPTSLSAPMLVNSAACCRHFCNVYGIPKTRAYIVGHNEIVSTACPGPLPWDVYMNLVTTGGVINPPYTFDNDLQGWTAGNCVNGPWHSNSGGWPGILYCDQTCNDAFIYSPYTNFTGGANQAAKVRLYNPDGGAHNMQLFWTSAANPSWSEANSSGVVNYSSATGWTEVFLPLTTATWVNHNITRLRLDFDNSNGGHRWHVDSITIVSSLGNLTGTVTNATSGAALGGATVTLSGVGNTTTNASGVYTFSNVNAGTYTVSASKASFNGDSSSVTITPGATATKNFALTPSDAEAPSVPTGLAGNATGPTTVQLSWNASTDNIGVAGYDVRRDGATVGSSTGTSYTDNAATPDTTHSYQVRAKDAVPNYSAWSDAAEVTTPPAPPEPTVVFSDGFNGNLNNWTQQVAGFDYSTGANRGGLTGAGAAFVAAGEADQMYHLFARPFAQGKVSGYFWDAKGGWKATVCGWSYRQSLSLREMGGTAGFILDNCFASNVGNGDYFYRYLCCGWGSAYTSTGARDAATDCEGTWVHFETTVTPGAPGASPGGAISLKVTDRAGAKTATPNLEADFFNWGIGRITLGLGVSSTNEGYWDDISFTATPPGVPTMAAPTVVSGTQIDWNLSPADHNHFGWDVAGADGTIVSPQYPAAGWLNHNALSWTETALTPNTAYTRKARAWNGTLNGAYSSTVTAHTLSPAPAAGSVTAASGTVCAGDDVTWTAVGGFGPGKVAYYEYAWDQNGSHTFTGAEAVWDSGDLVTPASAAGTWYLHVRGFNDADAPNGTYSYAVTAEGCAPPAIVDAMSRKTHGDAGDMDLHVAAAPTIEPRSSGPTKVMVTFDKAIQGAGGLDAGDVSVSAGSVTGVAIDGSELTVDLSGVPSGVLLLIGFPGITDAQSVAVAASLCVPVLTGDVTGDYQTNIFDLIAVRNALNAAVTDVNFILDVNADGAINIFDLITVRNGLNATAPACP